MNDITVLIAHIPSRSNFLGRAIQSVVQQTHKPHAIHIEVDRDRTGSAQTRNRALGNIQTRWTAFLDDDDVMLPNHLDVLLRHAMQTHADVVYSGCHVIDPLGKEVPLIEEWGRFSLPFDANLLRQQSYIPVTSLVRTQFAQCAMFGPPAYAPTSDYDDWGFYVRMLDLHAQFSHIPVKTWVWHHHGHNTSGRTDRW